MHAQISPQAEAKAKEELNRRGLDEEQVRKKLEERGIDLNNLNPANAQEMLAAQAALDEVLKELESEKVNIPSNPNSKPLEDLKEDEKKIIAKQSEEVSDAIDEGASLEEAVSETLTDDQTRTLPKSQIYGQEIFRSQSIKFYRQSKDVKAPNNYVLGVGDIIAISIWGASEESQVYEINEDGYIKPNGIPRVYLKGINYGEAKQLLKRKFSNFYNFGPNQFEISLNFSRTINVSVVGEVYNFGSFNIPAINTAFNALVAAGGPNDIGSVRKIQLMRAGVQPRTIDIYKYLSNPSIESDFYLQENDIINVPTAEKLVSISGAVKKPFIYELLANENLKDLIKYARGLKPNALKKNIQIIRYEDDEEKIIDVNYIELESSSNDFKLMPGDRVTINSINSNFDNFVEVSGAIGIGGKYAFVEGERISDLMSKLEIKDDALLDLAFVKRLNEDRKTISYIKANIKEAVKNPNGASNIALQSEDRIVILSKSLFVDESTVTITGAVRNPNTFAYDYEKSLKVSDALFLAGGVRTDATGFAYIKREDPTNPKQVQYIKIDIEAIQNDINSPENLLLEARDRIEVSSKNQFTDAQFITVEGYVRDPGNFTYDESLTIEDALLLAGGLKYEAAGNKIDIYRVDINDANNTKIIVANVEVDKDLNVIGENITLMPFDQINVRRAPEFNLQQNIVISGNVKYPGKYALLNKNERLSDIIKRAGGLSTEASLDAVTIERGGSGFIVADFPKAMKKPGSIDDIILKSGDNINVPKLQNLISITGYTTANELYKTKGAEEKILSVPFEEGKNANYYINKYAGGIAINGSKKDITVTELNGRVDKVNKFLFFKNYPEVGRGATITVGPKEIKSTDPNRKNIDWGQVVQSSVAQATSILTLLLLIDRLD